MAFKNGPLIGPDLFTRYMTPYYREMITHLKKLGQTVIGVDSDGNVDVLLKLFHDIGMNMMNPFEQAAGNDILAIRAKYPNLLMWGGIDKRILLDGRDAIDREIDEKVAPMWEQGGFFPSIDHSTPPCPMENFNYFLKRLQAVCE
jgi:uroporphyrinogen decarboxylase